MLLMGISHTVVSTKPSPYRSAAPVSALHSTAFHLLSLRVRVEISGKHGSVPSCMGNV